MKVTEANSSLTYENPPWLFRGSAVYQLHLVKSETARAFIPKECRLVEAFGYTLGGFFLASYDDSPAGVFDELVVVAGIVWNPPTSCAWAARVLVNSKVACDHGRKHVGLPSHVASFSKRISATPTKPIRKIDAFLKSVGLDASLDKSKDRIDFQVTEIKGSMSTNIRTINLTTLVPGLKSNKWMGPQIKMSLPSFSGCNEQIPDLLKYSCQIDCRVRTVPPLEVSSPMIPNVTGEQSQENPSFKNLDLSISVMLSRPILALQFSCLTMVVKPPIVFSSKSRNTLSTS